MIGAFDGGGVDPTDGDLDGVEVVGGGGPAEQLTDRQLLFLPRQLKLQSSYQVGY